MKGLQSRSYIPIESNLVLGLKIAAVAVATLAIFYQDLVVLANDALQSEYMNYILVIPFLFAYLLYRKRRMLRAAIGEKNEEQKSTRYLPAIAGILLSATAILLYWHGSYTFTPLQYHMIALPLFAAGLVLIFFNGQTLRHSIFAVALLFLLTPPPLDILYSWGYTLSVASSEVSYNLVRLLQIPATLTSESGTPIIHITGTSGAAMSFAVDVACSGIYSLIGFLVFAVFTAYIIRDKLWKKLVLFLIGFLLIYLINIARITTILLIGYQFGEQMALQLFHLLGGWILIFIGTIILLIFGEKILHAQIFAKSTEKCAGCNPKSERTRDFCLSCGRVLTPAPIAFRKSEIAKIVAVVAVVILLVSIQVPVFALTKGPAQVLIQTSTGEQGNTQLLPQISNYEPKFLYRDTDFENLSGQEASLIYVYQPSDETKDPIYVAVEIASTTGPLHPWEYCLVGPARPAYATQLDLTDIRILDNPPIVARYFAFILKSTNQSQVVLYWYESAVFMANGTAQQKQVKISLITYPDSPQNLTRKEELLPFATAIAQYWEPIKTWTQVALLLSQQSLPLAAATGIPIPVITVLFILRKRNERKANTRAYPKLSRPTRDIIDIVSETEKTMTSTLHAISTAYENRTGESIENEKMLEKLGEVEKTGIIKRETANVQDQPTQVWKTQMTSTLRLASVFRFSRPRFRARRKQ
jgi:exosortase